MIKDLLLNTLHCVMVSGLLPGSAARRPLALLVPVPGDVDVLLLCGREGDIPLGGSGSHAAAVRQPPGERAAVRHG